VLETIRERAPVDISVVGHTDTVGKKEYNYGLSMKRAKAVASILVAKGIDPSVIDITSHGKDNPLVPTGDQVPEPRNRRVEITVR
jgi:outer membrane protein OmpA-like peptidoglycan-associated protein